jgi:serine-type D-Ala-D-Ala carboxypeptidase/endopeptidase (penicillin-binding protein 4)
VRARRGLVIAAAVLVWQAAASGAAEHPLRAALSQRALRGARVGVLVVRADDGRVVFDQGAKVALKPASNLKVLTSVAALATFGPAHRFVTRVYSDVAPDSNGAVGTLMVRGAGDPSLTSEQWWRLAADLGAAGLRSVRGDVVLDDTAFDDQRWNPQWGDRTTRAFHASVSALTANYGAFAVSVRPGSAPGQPARVTIDPPVPYLSLVGQVRTVAPGAAKALSVDPRPAGQTENVVVGGSVSAGAGAEAIARSVADPTLYAGAVLRMQLQANGIEVKGTTRVAAVPLGAHEVLAFDGKPLAEIVRLLLKYSNNNMTEMLVKAMGARDSGIGSWDAGLAVVRATLTALGVDLDGCKLVDGSGLAAANRVTPASLVSALRIAGSSFAFGPELVAALPIAHRDGTLEHRAAGATDSVRAKTGLLEGATALSGFARLRDGTEVVFSIIVNDYKSGDAEAMAAVDGFVAALVNARLQAAGFGESRPVASNDTADGRAQNRRAELIVLE